MPHFWADKPFKDFLSQAIKRENRAAADTSNTTKAEVPTEVISIDVVAISETRLSNRQMFMPIFGGYQIYLSPCQPEMEGGPTMLFLRGLDLKIRTIFLDPEEPQSIKPSAAATVMDCLICTWKWFLFVLFLHQILSQVTNDTNSTTSSITTLSSVTKRAVTKAETTSVTKAPLPTQPPTDIPPNTDIGSCPCDLTAHGCDVNCCCDSDCSSDDQQAFSHCIAFNPIIDDRLCFPENLMTVNVYFKTNVSDDGILCIYYDNKAERNFYKNPKLVTTEEMFLEYEKRYSGPSYKVQEPKAPTFGDFYKSGNSIYILGSDYVAGYFTLPTTLATGFCVDNNPAAYLVDKTQQCVRDLKSLDEECEISPRISAYSYFEDFKIVVTPKVFEESFLKMLLNKTADTFDSGSKSANQLGLDLYNSNYTIAISNVTLCSESGCFDPSEFNSSANQFAPMLSGSRCTNVVNKVVYRFIHNGTYGIISVRVTLNLIDLTQSDLPFTQTFTTEFHELAAEDDTYFRRSGNPGYLKGEPLLAGTKINLPTGRSIINLSSDRTNWLTIPQPSPDGSCSGKNRVPVNFGVDMRSGCSLKLKLSDLSFEAPDQCTQVVTGMQIQVLYAKIGSIRNPQPKIIGVSFTYEKPKTISLQCNNLICDPTNYDKEYTIELVTSVAFQDVSEPALKYFTRPPPQESGLPYDFFYPFYSSGSVKNYEQHSTIYFTIFAIFQMFLLL
ncbi:tectonic-3-like [Octopus sinensis]|uniref:Tectonic-3-like n=1 Tax=Octopus sinensis TaxID=2607531 RepID=A0A7E6EYB1_9MOLL|nr:tectonic-3-like [Octopus sinensis]